MSLRGCADEAAPFPWLSNQASAADLWVIVLVSGLKRDAAVAAVNLSSPLLPAQLDIKQPGACV